MNFYDLSKEKRQVLVKKIELSVKNDLKNGQLINIKKYASNKDTYIRRTTYLALGKIYRDEKDFRKIILSDLKILYEDKNEKIRQTAAYTLGEIGKIDFEKIADLLEKVLYDDHHCVRNAVIGALKQMGEKNHKPTLAFAKRFIHHRDPKIRRQIIHGIELRGRTHPEDILPLLEESQNDQDKKIKEMIVHVLSQISYKEGCLEKVVTTLKSWQNEELVGRALEEILDLHKRHEKFSEKSYREAKEYIKKEFGLVN